MFRFSLCLALALVISQPKHAFAAAEVLFDFPVVETCPTPDPALDAEYAPTWTQCERWVWSCIRAGLEANLYAKQCAKVRREAHEPNFRAPYQFAPFYDPDRFARANALSDNFVRTLLSDPRYSDKIPPMGIRIFGAYFAGPVNLENIATTKNLVLDGSIFKRGLRMTNFRSDLNVSFDGCNIRGAMRIMRARIDGSLFLERGVYDFIDARDAQISMNLEASRSVFTDMLRLDRAQIGGIVYLVKSRLTSLNAWDAKIGGSMELRLADIRMRADLSGSTIGGDLRLQELAFGRQARGRRPSCEWDAEIEIDHILHEAYALASTKDTASGERILDEMMRTRPTEAGKPAYSPCDEAMTSDRRKDHHEMLLKSMKIDGTLCMIDTTGEIGVDSALDPPRTDEEGFRQPSLDAISLDGTRATSTVLRWRKSESRTLWRAANFKTGTLVINLEAPPARHFLDNLDVEFVTFERINDYSSRLVCRPG